MPIETSDLSADWLRKLRKQCRAWYDRHGRELPWRSAKSPAYRVWVSEIMLQQTTVAAVIPYYERFLSAFPDVHALAEAAEGDVLRLWEGLGYYSRAKNLHKAAGVVVSEHDGEFPSDVASLQKLPGIGRYTASAIASFAFDEPAGVVEANTVRLYSRLLCLEEDPKTTAAQKRLWEFAERIVPKQQPGAFNSALMDLGSLVCTVKDPDCPACPLVDLCGAAAEGKQDVIPKKSARPKITDVTEAAVVLFDDSERVLLRQRTAAERWSGMWDVPRFELPAELRTLPESAARLVTDSESEFRSAVVSGTEALTGLVVRPDRYLRQLKHGVTRYRIRLLCVAGEVTGGELRTDTEYQWATPDEAAALAVPVTTRKLLDGLGDAGDEQRGLF